jgi:hypothetical protein
MGSYGLLYERDDEAQDGNDNDYEMVRVDKKTLSY